MTLQQRKREEEECFYTAGVVPPKLAAKLQNQSLLARRTWLLLGKLDFVIN